MLSNRICEKWPEMTGRHKNRKRNNDVSRREHSREPGAVGSRGGRTEDETARRSYRKREKERGAGAAGGSGSGRGKERGQREGVREEEGKREEARRG
jgi:hypothetical protein